MNMRAMSPVLYHAGLPGMLYNVVRDITFDNIRVEDFRQGQLVNIRIFFNTKYCAAPGTCIKNVLFKDIDYNGGNAEMSGIGRSIRSYLRGASMQAYHDGVRHVGP